MSIKLDGVLVIAHKGMDITSASSPQQSLVVKHREMSQTTNLAA